VFGTSFLLSLVALSVLPPDTAVAEYVQHKDHSDIDEDGDVDLDDLKEFSRTKLETDWAAIDWPSWVVDPDNQRWDKHYHRLFLFIYDYWDIDSGDPLAVKNKIVRPTRIAMKPNDEMWVTDPGVGSVFLLNSSLQRIGELRGLDQPLGIALDSSGRLYVGDDERDRIEVFEPTGRFVRSFGAGLIRKPVDIDIHKGLVYVADAEAGVVWVFDTLGEHKRTIRKGMLSSPIAVEVATRENEWLQLVDEVYVLDKNDHFCKIYDTKGVLKSFFGGFPQEEGGMWNSTWVWKGTLPSPQSLFLDDEGMLHVLDIYLQKVQILDPYDGSYVDHYGAVGSEAEQFKLPLDIAIDSEDRVLAADSQLARVEVIR
jgi:DNA-binding beta-propeller fold protein YncE